MACKRSPVRSRLAPPPPWFLLMFNSHILEEIDSTQEFIKTLDNDAPNVVIAALQTAGKGRHGRQWISEAGQGLWMSLSHPNLANKDFRLVDFMLRAINVIPHQGQLGIKWPNDLVSRRQDGSLSKLGGLIGEWVGDTLYIGIGINVLSSPMTEPPALPSSSLRDLGIHIESISELGLAIASHYFQQKPIKEDVWKWPQAGMTIAWENQVGIVEAWLPDQRLQVAIPSGSIILSSHEVHGLRSLRQ